MSFKAIDWARSQKNISSSEKFVLVTLAIRCRDNNDFKTWPSKKTIQNDTCLSINTVDKAISSLVKKGLISKYEERKGSSTVYEVHVDTHPKNEEKLSTAHPNIDPPHLSTAPPKFGIPTPPKSGIGGIPNLGYKTISETERETRRSENPTSSFPSSSSFFDILILEKLKASEIEPTPELLSQIDFYCEKSIEKQDRPTSLRKAISIIRRGDWNTPHGWNGLSPQDSKARERKHYIEKQAMFAQDKVAMHNLTLQLAEKLKEPTTICTTTYRHVANQDPEKIRPNTDYLKHRATLFAMLGKEPPQHANCA